MTPEEIFQMWQKDGDDFTVFHHEDGGGVLIIKSDEAKEAVLKGVSTLRERKRATGSYER